MRMSESRQKALDTAKRIFSTASGNLLYQKWRSSAIASFDFYDGVGQYHPEVLQLLHQRGQAPIVVNKVKSMINRASGLEINTRGKIAFRPQSNNEQEEELAKAMTHYGYAVQTDQNFSFKGSLRCRDALICGIGWSSMEAQYNQILYDYVHPLNVIFDADDFSPQMTDMQYLIHMHWLSPDSVKAQWPEFSKEIDEISDYDYSNTGNFTPEFFNRTSAFIPTNSGSFGNGSRLLVNEVFQKEKRNYYCGIDKNGYYFETFDEEYAEKLANKKSEIEEEAGTQIVRTVYCNDILFNYAPLFPNIPNRKDFSLVPCVWLRRTSDAVPVGQLEEVKDLQRELNYRKLKEIMSLNSVRAVIDADAFGGMSAEEIREELQRPDTILFKSGPGQVDIVPNLDITGAMMKASERIDYELQQVTGMYSDFMGDNTNAQSGVAIKARQIASSKGLAFGFDAFTHVKEREGKLMINLMQGSGLENILVNIVLDDDEKQQFIMNLTREVNGKQHVFNDIRTIPVDIYVEIVPDYDSSFEEQREMFLQIMNNQQAPLLLQNPYLAKFIAGRDANKFSDAMRQLNEQQNAQQLAMKGGGGMPQMPPSQSMNPTDLGEAA